MFFVLFLRFWHFWQEKDVTNLAPNFSFPNMGYVMLLFKKNFSQGSQNQKKQFWNMLSNQKIKRFKIWVFLLFLVTKWRGIQILKRYVFWLDEHIAKLFSALRSSWKDFSNSNIRYPILAKPKFGTKSEKKNHKVLENDKFFFFGASFRIIE